MGEPTKTRSGQLLKVHTATSVARKPTQRHGPQLNTFRQTSLTHPHDFHIHWQSGHNSSPMHSFRCTPAPRWNNLTHHVLPSQYRQYTFFFTSFALHARCFQTHGNSATCIIITVSNFEYVSKCLEEEFAFAPYPLYMIKI